MSDWVKVMLNIESLQCVSGLVACYHDVEEEAYWLVLFGGWVNVYRNVHPTYLTAY